MERIRRETQNPSIGIKFFIVDDERFQDEFENQRYEELVFVRGRSREETIYCVLNEFWRLNDKRRVDVPPVKEFLKSPQKSGRELVAEAVYNETFMWLKARGCDKLVTVQMVEQYAMSVSRWIQCEEIVSSTGFLAKLPTTGAAIASPYVSMIQSYMKQTHYCWMQIY